MYISILQLLIIYAIVRFIIDLIGFTIVMYVLIKILNKNCNKTMPTDKNKIGFTK